MRYYADILGAILPCISDKEEKIRVVSLLLLLLSDGNCRFCMQLFTFFVFNFYLHKVARETNEELRSIHVEPSDGFDVGSILSVARRLVFLYLFFFPFEYYQILPTFVICEFVH